jgi:hypothetical protein
LLAGLSVVVFVFLGLLIPLRVTPLYRGHTVLVWSYVLTTALIVTVGILARRSAAAAHDYTVRTIVWFWPLVTVAVVAAAVVATSTADAPTSAAAATALLTLVAGCLTWLAIVVIRRVAARLKARETIWPATSKTFAITTAQLAAVCLLLALTCMPLTKHYQTRALPLIVDQWRYDVGHLLGAEWPGHLRPLPDDVFTLDRPTTAQAQ